MSTGQSRAGFVGDFDMRKWSILGVLTDRVYLSLTHAHMRYLELAQKH